MNAELILSEIKPGLPEDRFNLLFEQLKTEVNRLILEDFQKLVFVLYRIDVPEKKLKEVLQISQGQDAAVVISQLMIERQLEKIKTRQQFRTDLSSDEERW